MRRDEESREDKRKPVGEEEAHEVLGDQIWFDSTIVGGSKEDKVALLSSSSL